MKATNYRSNFKLDNSNRDFNSNSRKSSARIRPELLSMGSRTTSQSFSQSQIPGYLGTPRTSSDNSVSYGFVADKVLQQCTMFTYPGNPVADPVYPNHQVTLPPSITPFNRIGTFNDRNKNHRSVYHCPSESDDNSQSDERLIFDKFQSDCDKKTESRYSGYNESPGIDSNNKISKWIDSLPIFELGDNRWESGCYYSDFSANWEEFRLGDQSNDDASIKTSDELLHLLCKKFDSAVCNLYTDFNESPV